MIAEHGPPLLRFCAAQTGAERAEDVFQETMLAALRAYTHVRDPASIRSWLFSIAARKAIDVHRAQARAPQPLADPEPSSQPAGDLAPQLRAGSAGPLSIVDETIWGRVRRLPAKQRQAVMLRFLGDLSHREIAEVMQTSEAAARRNVFEALKRLRVDLESSPTSKEHEET
ncbi:MAG: RNA polymerase sigma factor [Solirubrobacteraceae bacterium]